MSNLQDLTEKESSCFILLWPVTLLNNDVRTCWDKPDEVLSATRLQTNKQTNTHLFVFPLLKGVICLMMDPENTQGNHMPSTG